MSKQKILLMDTYDPSIRSEVDGWSGEDGDLINPDKPIGLSKSLNFPCYKTVMNAIGDGWRLMAPPVEGELIVDTEEGDDTLLPQKTIKTYTWWLEK